MQQRQLRLGDILDDYCPRERRLANHTIVAMVGDEIRLTRCTTCDTEHPYKGGKAPRLRKKKSSVETAYDEVLDSVKQDAQPQGVLVTPASDEPEPVVPTNPAANSAVPPSASDNGGAPTHVAPEEVRLHRPLIRAQLPRIEREPVGVLYPNHDPAGQQEAAVSKQLESPVCQERRTQRQTRAAPVGRTAAVRADAPGPQLDAIAPARPEKRSR